MLKSEGEAKGYLGESNLDALRECVEVGFARYFTLSTDMLADMLPRTRATLIQNFIIAEARRRFYGIAQMLNVRQLFILDFGEIQVRFKKFNRKLRPQNIATNQTLAYMYQEPLPGIPWATKCIVGYQPNRVHSDIQCIAIVCPNGKEYRWYFYLEKTSRPAIPLHEEQISAGARVRPKEGLTNEQAGNNSKDF